MSAHVPTATTAAPGVRPDPTPTVGAVRAALEPLLADAPKDRSPTLVVALSGGLDSVVLLHILRFHPGFDTRLVAAHFDHGMRPRSARDAAWVRGLCRAWGVELITQTAGDRPTSEDAARTARYDFLREVATACDPSIVLTAHHADDQAETVLFRALRGTGIEGLAGIPRLRPLRVPAPTSGGSEAAAGGSTATLARPLLDVWREELEAYAGHYGLRWRDDPTNEQLGYARNVLRHEILPMAEEKVAAGTRRALVRLGEIARDEEAAWTSAMPLILDAIEASIASASPPGGASVARDDARVDCVSCDRESLLALGPELSARVVRHLVASVGHTLDADATRRAVDFAHESQSGRRIELGRGVELRLEGDRVVIDP